MSLINNNQEIYNEMEYGSKKSSTGIASKLVASVLFLSIGFAAGNIYTVFNQNKTEAIIAPTNSSNILTTNTSQIANSINSNAISISDIANMNSDSVVEITISTTNSNVFFGNYTSTGSGSGVIISSDGYILTNNHVINSANEINIRLHDGTEYKATVVGSDSRTDIGILKVDAKNLKPVVVGDSDKLVVG